MHRISKIFRTTLIPIAILTFQVAYAETYTGRVVGVSDGDTITVLDRSNVQHKVRLSGIDAPEKAQPYGQRANSDPNWTAIPTEPGH
jgi:endonuclease YncB( thermonuclease family)